MYSQKETARSRCFQGCSYTTVVGLLIAAMAFSGILVSYNLHLNISKRYWMTSSAADGYTDDALEAKLVLAWNSFYKDPYFGCQGAGSAPFHNCPEPNCYLTTNRSLVTKATTVLFHIADMDSFPDHRTPSQMYVFFMREAASRDYNFKNDRSLRKVPFNLTMTYRRDSDIPLMLGKVYKLPNTLSKTEPYRLKYPFATRKRSVAWVASFCQTDSKRELYVKQLQQYIDIDVYGGCGNLSCAPRGSPDERSFFSDTIPSKYKFYLAFENSICKDYVTEKLFRALQSEIVPIVLGGTNYSRDAPPHSYINVLDYKSPRALAAYLRRLSRNETEYLKYFQWKNSYFQVTNQLKQGCCKLCERVNTPSYHKTYDDVMNWWSRDMCDNEILLRKRAM